MTKFLGIFVFLLALMSPAFAQQPGRLSPDDQKDFDKYYTKWVNDTRKNDRDDIAKDVGHMEEIMGRNGIPANVPFAQVASTGAAYPARNYRGRLSAHDQSEFDKNYTKWVNDTRKNDRDDIARDERHMQDIMARNNIPPNVPFDQIASTGYANNGIAAYPANGSWQGRLTPDDQRDFDRYYSRWVDDMRVNNRDAVAGDAARMQEIMARNNIPANVPFDQMVGNGEYQRSPYSNGGYPAYGQTASHRRFSMTSIKLTRSGSKIRARMIATTLIVTPEKCRILWPATTSRPMSPSTRLRRPTRPYRH